jgi:hypothetical protein
MNGHGQLLRRTWMIGVGAVVLIAGHAVALRYLSSHTAFPAAVVSGVIALVAIKHLGLLGPLYALIRRRFRRSPR